MYIFSIVDPKGRHISVIFKTSGAAVAYLNEKYPSCPCGTILNQGYTFHVLKLEPKS